jgi:hypothetical protein
MLMQGDELTGWGELLAIFLVIGLPCLIFWWLGWFKRDSVMMSAEKTNFGPDKPKNMRSWEGAFYILWNWKSYAAKTVWIGAIPFVWYLDGFGAAFGWFCFGGILVLMGKFWELFKR